jgi:hypothetical protein
MVLSPDARAPAAPSCEGSLGRLVPQGLYSLKWFATSRLASPAGAMSSHSIVAEGQ